MNDRDQTIRRELEESAAVLAQAAASVDFRVAISEIARVITISLQTGGKLMLAGNGGSAGDSQHIAAEFVSRLNFDRAPLAAIALTVDTSALLAIGNDYGFERVFERQLLALGRPGDVFIGISTSAKSPNVVAALKAAREKKITTIGMIGENDGPMVSLCDLVLRAPSCKTPMIQQAHITAAHSICGLVETAIFGSGA